MTVARFEKLCEICNAPMMLTIAKFSNPALKIELVTRESFRQLGINVDQQSKLI